MSEKTLQGFCFHQVNLLPESPVHSVQRQCVCLSSQLLSSGHIALMLRASEVPAINSVHYVGKLMKWADFKRALLQLKQVYCEALWECYIPLILTTIHIKVCCLPLQDKGCRLVCVISLIKARGETSMKYMWWTHYSEAEKHQIHIFSLWCWLLCEWSKSEKRRCSIQGQIWWKGHKVLHSVQFQNECAPF